MVSSVSQTVRELFLCKYVGKFHVSLIQVWAPGVGYEGEVSQGKLLVDAAKATGIKHFVWSTLDSTIFKVRHWESKHAVDQHLQKSGVPRTS
jgi:NmrA-like family